MRVFHGPGRIFPVLPPLLACLLFFGVAASDRPVSAEAHPSSRFVGRDPLLDFAVPPDGEVRFGESILRATALGRRGLDGETVDLERLEREIDRLAAQIRPLPAGRKDPRETVSAIGRLLFDRERFSYDCAAGDPDNFLLDRVLARKRGNCLGLSSLYLILAERLSIPLVGVYLPSHCFVRYEEAGIRFNIETGDRGAEWGNGRYLREFGLSADRPYLRSLGRKQMLAVYLKSLGAAFSRGGREEEAIALYRASAALYPALPDAWFNLGVSFQKTGRRGEAIAQYRRAIALDPGLAVARDNLAVALAREGRFPEALEQSRKAAALAPNNPVTRGNLAATLCACGMLEEGIREFRKVLRIDPGNARALAGLAKAHHDRGDFREALGDRDRAVEAGCRMDPVLRRALESCRSDSAESGP